MGSLCNSEPIMVTIRCFTYNHEHYIRRCLEGFVMQITNFRFEAIVHDDASTDGTAAILREYADKYPDIIKPIYEIENQYSKKDGTLNRIMNEHTHGKFAAMCEGDDYWTDPLKLQRQFDFLNMHDDYVAVAENGIVINQMLNQEYLFSDKGERDLNLLEILESRQFPTASVLLKKEILDMVYNENDSDVFDTFLWAYCLTIGKFKYLPKVSSVYLKGQQGITVSTERLKWAQINECWAQALENFLYPKYVKDQRFFREIKFREYYSSFVFYIKRHDFYNALIAARFSIKLNFSGFCLNLFSFLIKKD